MNPVKKFEIGNYKEILKEIAESGKIEHLRDLEDRVIQEIICLARQGTKTAKENLQRLEKHLDEDLGFKPRNFLLISALNKSIKGALSAAKFCL